MTDDSTKGSGKGSSGNSTGKIKIKEYDEIQCNRESCKKVFPVKGNTEMKDGRHGICTCPHCGKAVRAVKTRPSEDDYIRLPTGQRVRKIPKSGLNKKQRRKATKAFKETT